MNRSAYATRRRSFEKAKKSRRSPLTSETNKMRGVLYSDLRRRLKRISGTNDSIYRNLTEDLEMWKLYAQIDSVDPCTHGTFCFEFSQH